MCFVKNSTNLDVSIRFVGEVFSNYPNPAPIHLRGTSGRFPRTFQIVGVRILTGLWCEMEIIKWELFMIILFLVTDVPGYHITSLQRTEWILRYTTALVEAATSFAVCCLLWRKNVRHRHHNPDVADALKDKRKNSESGRTTSGWNTEARGAMYSRRREAPQRHLKNVPSASHWMTASGDEYFDGLFCFPLAKGECDGYNVVRMGCTFCKGLHKSDDCSYWPSLPLHSTSRKPAY